MRSKSSINTPGALVKAKRDKIKKIEAVSIKPPKVIPDTDGGNNHSYLCVYVDSKFQQVKHPCSFDVWRRCEGRTVAGKTRDGLDSRLSNNFYLVENTNGLLVDIDIIPKTFYTTKALMPADDADKEDIVIKVSPKTGSMEVLQCPAGVTKTALKKIMDSLDKMEMVQTGDTINSNYEVLNANGNAISIAPLAS